METYLADKVSLSSGELVEIGMSDLESHPIETLRKIYREIDLSRGPTEVICDCGTARGASWGADDRIVFAGNDRGLWRVAATQVLLDGFIARPDGALARRRSLRRALRELSSGPRARREAVPMRRSSDGIGDPICFIDGHGSLLAAQFSELTLSQVA